VLVDGSFPLAPTCPDYSALLSGCSWLSVYVDALCPAPSPLAKVSTGTRPDGDGTGQRASRHIDKHEQSGLFASLCSGFSRGMTPCEPPLQVPRRHGIRFPVRPFDRGKNADIGLLGGGRSESQDHVAILEAESTELEQGL
jgi:hypothetical protein